MPTQNPASTSSWSGHYNFHRAAGTAGSGLLSTKMRDLVREALELVRMRLAFSPSGASGRSREIGLEPRAGLGTPAHPVTPGVPPSLPPAVASDDLPAIPRNSGSHRPSDRAAPYDGSSSNGRPLRGTLKATGNFASASTESYTQDEERGLDSPYPHAAQFYSDVRSRHA